MASFLTLAGGGGPNAAAPYASEQKNDEAPEGVHADLIFGFRLS